jgi:class 3 adenylate cyclase
LHTLVEIAHHNNGHVTRFNDNSVLIFFQGTTKETLSKAVITAMKIKFMLSNEEYGINTLLKRYSEIDFSIGIDHGKSLCTKVSIDGEYDHDLFWIGNCINKSAAIGRECKSPNHIGISHRVYENLKDNPKYGIRKNYCGHDEKIDIWTRAKFIYNEDYEYYYHTDAHVIVD